MFKKINRNYCIGRMVVLFCAHIILPYEKCNNLTLQEHYHNFGMFAYPRLLQRSSATICTHHEEHQDQYAVILFLQEIMMPRSSSNIL